MFVVSFVSDHLADSLYRDLAAKQPKGFPSAKAAQHAARWAARHYGHSVSVVQIG